MLRTAKNKLTYLWAIRKYILAVLVMLWTVSFPLTTLAINQNTLNSILNNTYFFDPSASSCNGTSSNPGATAASAQETAGSIWNSTAQPPYYLEEFVINVLQDIAQKLGVPASNAVTQEHVIALVAWGYAEGGNIANTGAFNIWNTGLLSRPDLVAGGTNASGLQSFVSFNAGVEANAISMTTPNQSRIGQVLVQQGTTAEQVLHTIAYYDETQGNKAWAWGNSPNDPAAVLQFNHTTYITSLLDNLTNTRQSYGHRASVVIGPGEESTNYVDVSKLQFNGGASNSTTATTTGSASTASACGQSSTGLSPDCQTASGVAKIICDAKKYDPVSYSETVAGGHQGGAAWHASCPIIGPSCVLDCSGLVNIAVYDVYGVDLRQNTYAEASDTTDWQHIDVSKLQPGDLIQPNAGHVEIVDHISGDTIYTFAAHTSDVPQPDQVGPAQYTKGQVYLALHYIGPGSSGQ